MFNLDCRIKTLAVIWINSPINEFPPTDWFSLWNHSRLRYCTDGAANYIMQFCKDNVAKAPHIIAGDFDSISSSAKEYFVEKKSKLIHIHDQDSTDLTKTLRLITKSIQDEKLNVSVIVLLGGLHGRFDHIFGALNAVVLHNEASEATKIPVLFIDNENIVTVLKKGSTHIELDDNKITKICGIIPISQCETIVSSTGFRWNLEKQHLKFGGIVSSSNHIMDASGLKIITSAPTIFTFELKDKFKIC